MKYPFLDLRKVTEPLLPEMTEAAARVIAGGRYIGGPEVEGLENDLAQLCRTDNVVGVSNGLDALRLIFRAYKEMGVMKDGDEVIVPANTYIATILAVSDNGLKPVLVDADERTMNLDFSLVEKAITPLTRAILPVHLYGCVAWDDKLAELAQSHNLKIIEDNAQAIGAKCSRKGLYGSDMAGGLGDAAAFSFYPTKNIGAVGDAGAVATHDRLLADTVRALANYGSDHRYHNIYRGLNCRLDPIQAAILRVRLRHIKDENSARFANAVCYRNEIKNPYVKLPEITEHLHDQVWHQYVVRVADRDRFMRFLADNGVGCDIHYAVPPHRQPCYAGSLGEDSDYPVTCRIADEVVSLPVSPATTVKEASEIAHIINDYKP